MSDFEDDLSESEVSQNAPPKKQGMSLPKVSTPVALGAGLLALVGCVGVWAALNLNPASVPDPIAQTQPITTPSTTTPPVTTPTTAPTTAAGTGVEAGNIPLIADKPKPTVNTTATTASSAKPTAKPSIKPAPKPAAPRVVNPFAPLPQTGSTAVAVVNSGNQGGPPIAVFNPQPQQPTFVRPTAAPQVIRTPIVSSPFAPRPTNTSGVAVAAVPSGTSTAVKPVPVVVAQQRPVIPKVLITKTPQATTTTSTVAARPPITGLVARPAFSVTPQILSTQPRTQAPIQAITPINTNSNPTTTTNSTPSVTTPTTTAATQTPTTITRPTVTEPPVFKIEPPPVSRPATTPPATTTPTTNPTQPPTPTTTATQPSTNTTPVTPSTNTTQPNPSTTTTNTTPTTTQPNPSTTPATNTTPTTTTQPATNPDQPSTNTVSTNPPSDPTTSTTTTPTTPVTPANPNTTPTTPDPSITTPTIPAAPTADLLELRRVVQEDLRLEYAGFSIGTVKKAFFQSSRGLLSIAEGDPIIRDSSVILKSVSPTEVVLALGNELLTLPLVKR